MGMNFDQARLNMVEQQVRTWEVLDSRVLDVLSALHREDFVPTDYRKLAYADVALPLEHDQHMMKPVVEGRLLQALELKPSDRVLEIGTGSGYLTACIASLAGSVTSVDIHESFTAIAGKRLNKIGLTTVSLETGDVLSGWAPDSGFDAIVVGGSAASIPEQFLGWLKPLGRLVMVRGMSPVMEAVRVTRLEQGLVEDSLFETDLPRLIGAEDHESFSLQ